MVLVRNTGRGKLVERLTDQVGGNRELAEGILKKRGHMATDGSLTRKGEARDQMTARERAVDRASRASGKSPEEYQYNPSTNRATVRKRRSPFKKYK